MGSPKPEKDCKQELDDSGYVQDASMTEKYRGQAHLLDLSDDVLLCILRLCSPRDLKALGHTCPRLGTLVCDRTLWQKVDIRAEHTGPQRLRWYLTHALSASTRELQLTGYVNRDVRCLGIQDLTWPMGDPSQVNSNPGVDVEHFLLRMWYPHLPRYAMSPRWPDKREARGKLASKAAKKAKDKDAHPMDCSKPATANSSTSTSGPSNTDSKSSKPAPKTTMTYTRADLPRDMQMILSGCQGPQFTVNQSLFKMMRNNCQNLTSLSLEYCNLDNKETNLRFFPNKLKKLSLKGTMCYNLPVNMSYLARIQDLLPELESLDISECEWFEPSTLMPLSKLQNLQELYMRDCRRLTECVAYASLATRYGFQKLRKIDIRGSPVADSEVSAFGWLPLLEELYVSSPDDFRNTSEHSHKWEDVLAPFSELDDWEIEEPDYYKCRSPAAEEMEEDEDMKEDEYGRCPGQRLGDMLGGYINCGSLERRIIVIHPSRDNRPVVHRVGARAEPNAGPPAGPNAEAPAGANVEPPVGPNAEALAGPSAGAPGPPQPPPRPQPAHQPPQDKSPAEPSPGPRSGPSKRPHSDDALDLVKRPRIDKENMSDDLITKHKTSGDDTSEDQIMVIEGEDDVPKGPSGDKETDTNDDDMGDDNDDDDDNDKGNEREKIKEKPGPSDAEVRPPPTPVKLRSNEAGRVEIEVNRVGPAVERNQPAEEPYPPAEEPDLEHEGPEAIYLDQDDIDAIRLAALIPERHFLDLSYDNLNQCEPGHHDHVLYCRPFPFPRRERRNEDNGREEIPDERPAEPNIEIDPEPIPDELPDRPILTEEEKRARIAENNENIRRNLLELAGLNDVDPSQDHLLYYRPVSCSRAFNRARHRRGQNAEQNADQNAEQNDEQNAGQADPTAAEPQAGPSQNHQGNGTQSERFRLRNGDSAHFRIRGPDASISIRNGVPGDQNQDAEVEILHRVEAEENENGVQPQPNPNQNLEPQVVFDERVIPQAEAEVQGPAAPQNAPQNQPQGRQRRAAGHQGVRENREPIRHIDIDIHRQNRPIPNFGYHLVSDAAVLRFGRADNDNINYVHIGHNPNGNEPGVRPDRSNLRVLSITGFRSITDRSLEHLATAAPHLRFIDFSYTNVTPDGVEIFKAIRPNCKVVFSKYGQPN